MADAFYSVGIDVGTTTSQVIFSRITLKNTGGSFSIPDIRIEKTETVYKGAIHFTPLLTGDLVDAARLREIVAREYENSGIRAKDVSTGAVIITGESARKENAREVAEQLAAFAGDFVVCTAGPDYEAVLAGRGSGACEASETHSGRIGNFDIGGGTTNAAVFENGGVADAFAADIGGRLIRVNADGVIAYVSEKLAPLIQSLGLARTRSGEPADIEELAKLTARLAEMFLELAGERPLRDDTRRLFIGHPFAGLCLDRVLFSGGVAEYIYGGAGAQPADAAAALRLHGDIGPLLGAAVRGVLPQFRAAVLTPTEKIRATVVGAGSHSTAISGSTVAVDKAVLPLKNLPVVRVDAAEGDAPFCGAALQIAAQKRLYSDYETVAVAIGRLGVPGYAELCALASEIAQSVDRSERVTVVVTESDCAKALGLLLRPRLPGGQRVVCLDRIRVKSGDYIDIGAPVGGVVPVVVKTLLFGV